MTQYDKIAKRYIKNQEEKVDRKYLITPSFMKSLGDLKGKKVLDLACGGGYFTRKIKLAGSNKVVGIDISKEMINLAKKEEDQKPLGIKYFIKNVSRLEKIREFDIVSAAFLLHYSKTKEELLKMCKGVYNNLKRGGRFIALNINPDSPLTHHKKYGATIECEGPLKEGCRLITKLYHENKEYCRFIDYHWNKKTYEEVFKKAGFKGIKWIHLKVSEEGIKKLGKEFWKDYYKKPYIIIVKAIK